MARFCGNPKNRMTVKEVLQAAQKVLMQSKSTAHPFYWAGFVPVRGPQ